MKKIFDFALYIAKKKIEWLDVIAPHATALVDLGLRLWIALIFWKSGVLKIGNWDVTLILFEDEHPVPGLSPEIAAYLGTFNELFFPALLFIGLATRVSAIALLVSTAIIQYTYQASHEHFLWALLLFALLVRGAGLYSFDYFIRHRHMKHIIHVGKPSRVIALVVVSGFVIFTLHDASALALDSINPWLDDILQWWENIGT